MRVAEPSEGFLVRLDEVSTRLERHAARLPPSGLTEADPGTGERWTWGQVWAHLAEFPGYWREQIRRVLERPGGEVPPFGRVQTDPDRVAAIEADKLTPPPALWERVTGELHELRALLANMAPEDWARRVSHSTLGSMDMPRVMETFVVGHLESHAKQLDQLAIEGP